MTEFKTITEVNEALERFIPTAKTATKDYSQDQMQKLMAALGNPEKGLRVIHVAGTSGKTSTSYYLAACLREVGHTVGMTISPHIDSVAERIQINSKPLEEERFCRYFSEFLPLVEATGLHVSYFEVIIAMAYWVFAKEKVDYAVIEVGMGGRRDATNVVRRSDKVCVITDIGMDHTEVLGDTLAQIAFEKGGIIQDQNHVFMYEQEPEVMTVIDDIVAEKKANLHMVKQVDTDHVPTHLPLFQRRNWLLALIVVHTILGKRLTPKQQQASSQIVIPARMEIIQHSDKTIILDGSHNGQKMNALVVSLASRFPDQKFVVLAGFVESGNPRAFEAIDQLLPLTERIIFTTFSGKQDTPKQGINPDILSDYVKTKRSPNPEVIKDPAQAYKALLKDPGKLLLVTGSFYLMNHVRPLIKELK